MSAEFNDHSARAHALLSASSAHRWLACPPSAVVAVKYESERSDTEFTREGTIAHEVAEQIALGAGEEVLAIHGADASMIDHAIGYRDYIKSLVTSEEDSIMLEHRVSFADWVPDGYGTADCIIIHDDSMDVVDYKYGKGVAVDALNNPQMMLYALGAMHDFGFAVDVKTVRMHIYQPRMDNISVYEMTAEDLLRWADKVVKPKAEQAYKGKGKYHAGEHCRFCLHAGKCRALKQQCEELVDVNGKSLRIETLAP